MSHKNEPTEAASIAYDACAPILANLRAAFRAGRITIERGLVSDWRTSEDAFQLRAGAELEPRAVSRLLQELRAETGEDAHGEREHVAAFLSECLQGVKYAPGSGYRTTENPNPDGFRLEGVGMHGRFNDHPRTLPGVNVKAYPDLRGIDWTALRDELGLDAGTLAPTGRFLDADGDECDEDDEGATPELLPFGREWIEARYSLNGRDYARQSELSEGPESWARESGWEFGTQRVEELLGALGYRVKVEGRGRSGGYLCVRGLPDLESMAEGAAELAQAREELRTETRRLALLLKLSPDATGEDVDTAEDPTDESLADFDAEREKLEGVRECVRDLEDEHGDSAKDLERILGAWAELESDAEATCKDLGRATAWNVGANVFEHAAKEYADELAERTRSETVRADELKLLEFARASLATIRTADEELSLGRNASAVAHENVSDMRKHALRLGLLGDGSGQVEPEPDEDEDERKPLSEFIDANREELRAAILRAVPNVGELDDDALSDWIANDESLYRWAESEGYDV